MSLFEQYKPSLDKMFQVSMNQVMDEESFYEAVKDKFDILEEKIEGLSAEKAQKIFSKSVISRAQKVHNRILLIRDLIGKIGNADNFIELYMYPGLITYLYLTCFDQLGAPIKGWRFFPAWIDSKSCADEVETAIDSAMAKFDEPKLMVKDVYNQYHENYGVKNSFFRFLREILPIDSRNILLNSILVEKWANGNEQIFPFEVDDVYKEKWLHEVRNNYTHNLFTTQTNAADGKFIGEEKWLIRERKLTADGTIIIWVIDDFDSILENCVLQGIQVLIE